MTKYFIICRLEFQKSGIMMNKDSGLKKINGNYKGKDILSLDQFSPKDILSLYKKTQQMKKIALATKPVKNLAGKIVTIIFYEPSSRTFNSFAAAVKQLGGQTLEVHDPKTFSSVSKGETLEDTIRVLEAYSDAIVIRHNEIGTAQKAANAAEFVPIFNAGDGIGEHPTQALLDLMTIYDKHRRLNNLTGIMVGDLLYGRTIHSLIRGLSLFKNNTIYLLSPKELKLSREEYNLFIQRNIKLIEVDRIDDLPKNADFLYWTRVQKERFKDLRVYEKVKNTFILDKNLLDKMGWKNAIIMHPLPRVGEISTDIDEDKRSVYLKSQIRNGMYVRMALLDLILRNK